MGKLYDVVILRSLAILMVVAFHAYGMMYWGHFPEMTERYKELYYNFNQFVVNFRMPLFVFVSGYLFSFLERNKSKYPTLKALFQNKFKRLIIPYFVFATIYMLTTGCGFSIKTLMSGSCAHLWFITMLFWCFIGTRIFSLIPYSQTTIFRITLLTISLIVLFLKLPEFNFLGICSCAKFFFWFYLGYVISPYRNQLYDYLSKNKYWLFIFLLIYMLELILTIRTVETIDQRSKLVIFAHIAIVLFIWYVTNWAIRTLPKTAYDNVILKELNKTSYGIYVLHYWLQPFLLSSTAKKQLHIDSFATSHVFLFPLLFFITSFIISYIGTKILLKTKVGRFLVG